MDEVVDRIISAMILKLVDELLRAHVQHHLIRMHTLRFISDSLTQVRFTQSDTTIQHQRIERTGARLLCNSLSRSARNPVTVSFNKIVESIYVVQLRVDLHFFQ